MKTQSNTGEPQGKYNKWCERRPLVCADEEKIMGTDKYVDDNNLSLIEKAAFYTHDLVNCEGLEFVVFSNAYIKQHIKLPGEITLVPCFLGAINNLDNLPAKLTLDMIKKARFVYDGWMPIKDWQLESVRKAIRKINSALSIFSIQTSAWFSWETKYTLIDRSRIYYDYEQRNIDEINGLSSVINNMGEKDALAFMSSIGWLAQSVRLREPAAKFLFSILAIESLATYIEEGSEEESIFKVIKCEQLTKEQKNEQKGECIKEVILEVIDSDPEKAIKMAYFDCVIGIKKRLRAHMENILPKEKEVIESLFSVKVDGKTLYDIRNEIAHGRMDSLSDTQKGEVLKRSRDMERISRKYVVEVIRKSTGFNLSENQINEGVSPRFNEGIYSDETMYHGPKHMAIVYSQSYRESITLPKLG